MNPEQAWKSGVTLYQALFRFGDPAAANELARINQRPALLRMAEAFSEAAKSGFDAPKVQEAQATNSRALDLRRVLEKQILSQLAQGEILGVGFAVPRRPDDRPVPLPDDVWTGRVKWEDSAVKGNGIEFVAVRLHPAAEVEIRAPGRPSRREEIVAAFRELDAEGKINRASSLSSHFDLVKQRVHLHSSDKTDRGLGQQVLYETLAPLFQPK